MIKQLSRYHSSNLGGFTLVELLTVVCVISLLASILIPALVASKNQTRQIVCKNNLRQLAIANQSYANEHEGYSVPGALNIHLNLNRWYGTRKSIDEPFITSDGPLAPYLSGIAIKCPQKVNYDLLEPSNIFYEEGNGGYGYNFTYIGSQVVQKGYEDYSSYKESMKLTAIRRLNETLLFTDTAMLKKVDKQPLLLKYAFAEPVYLIINGIPDTTWTAFPSIHFRHRRQANVVWADCHVDSRNKGPNTGLSMEGTNPSDHDIGWFEPMDNSMFDLK